MTFYSEESCFEACLGDALLLGSQQLVWWDAFADGWSTAKPCDIEVLLRAVDCFPTVPASLPRARPSQACSFDGSLNFNGEIYEPQRRFVSDGSQESEVEEDRELVSTPKFRLRNTRRKKRNGVSLAGVLRAAGSYEPGAWLQGVAGVGATQPYCHP